MTIEDILALEDISKKIEYLKKGRKTKQPDTKENLAMWDISKHEIMWNKKRYPDRKVKVKDEETIFDEATGKTHVIDAQYEDEPVNRIAVPIEQDIINIQTAFTVGLEPAIDCTPEGSEQQLLDALKIVLRKNKIKFQNKKVVRSYLSEQEVAEYWYKTKDDGFWDKVWKKIKHTVVGKQSERKLKSVLWSPFRGDVLYPFFDDGGDMVAFSRMYKRKDIDDVEVECFTTITKEDVLHWEMNGTWKLIQEKSFKHGFSKLPVLYGYRSESYCKKIQPERERLENVLSSYADCMDLHFFPLLKLIGDIENATGKKRDKVVQLTGNGADAQYLTWNQAPDTVKLEIEKMLSLAYDMTNTPRITMEDMKGIGKASGTMFRLLFMSAHMAVSNHEEDLGDFLQRRVNFLVSALGNVNSELYKASKTIDIETELTPYMIDDLDDKVSTAVAAVEGGVWSRRDGVIFAGNAERIDETLKEIEEDMKKGEKNSEKNVD